MRLHASQGLCPRTSTSLFSKGLTENMGRSSLFLLLAGFALAGCSAAAQAVVETVSGEESTAAITEATDPPTATEIPATEVPSPTTTPAPTAIPTPTGTPTPVDPNADIWFTERGVPGQNKVALTIDDFIMSDVVYWWMIDYLDENPDVKLTMFPVGNRVPAIEEQNPGVWRKWLDVGNEIGYHTMNHVNLSEVGYEFLRADIIEFNRTVGEAVGDPEFRVRYARAPWGAYSGDRAIFEQAAQEFGITWVLWSVIPSHANYIGKTYGLDFPDAVHDGDIALFHVRWQDQYWMEKFVDELRRRGLEMVTLSELQFEPEDYYHPEETDQ